MHPREGLYDLDNVQPGVLSGDERQRSVEAVFELDYIIVGGYAPEKGMNSPHARRAGPTRSSPRQADRRHARGEHGLLQFKATPGVFHLEIREIRGQTCD